MNRNTYQNSITAAARVLAERPLTTGSPLRKAPVDRVLGPSRAYGRPASTAASHTVRAVGRGLMMGQIPRPVPSSTRRQSSCLASGPAARISATVQKDLVAGCGTRVPGVVVNSRVTARQEDTAAAALIKGILVVKGKKALRGLKKVVRISDEDRVRWFERSEFELGDEVVTNQLLATLESISEDDNIEDEICPFDMDEACDWPEEQKGIKSGEQQAEASRQRQGERDILEEEWILDEVCPFNMGVACDWPEEEQKGIKSEEQQVGTMLEVGGSEMRECALEGE